MKESLESIRNAVLEELKEKLEAQLERVEKKTKKGVQIYTIQDTVKDPKRSFGSVFLISDYISRLEDWSSDVANVSVNLLDKDEVYVEINANPCLLNEAIDIFNKKNIMDTFEGYNTHIKITMNDKETDETANEFINFLVRKNVIRPAIYNDQIVTE